MFAAQCKKEGSVHRVRQRSVHMFISRALFWFQCFCSHCVGGEAALCFGIVFVFALFPFLRVRLMIIKSSKAKQNVRRTKETASQT